MCIWNGQFAQFFGHIMLRNLHAFQNEEAQANIAVLKHTVALIDET